MSTLKTDAIEAATGTNTDLSLDGKGSGVPDLAAGFKVGSVAGVPTASIRDDAVTLAKLAAGTDGELITWDASGDPAAVAVGTATHVLTSNGAGAAPTFQAAGGGVWSVVTETSFSAVATFDVTGMNNLWRRLLIEYTIQAGKPTFTILDSGGSPVTAEYDWGFRGFYSYNAANLVYETAQNDTEVELMKDTGTTFGNVYIDMIISPTGTSETQHCHWSATLSAASGVEHFVHGATGCETADTTNINGLRFDCTTGNLTGKYWLLEMSG